MSNRPGTLYVVATPIGNLEDLSPRAGEVLRGVALILAEDTRVSSRLLSHLAARTPMAAYHDHNERETVPGYLERLLRGESLALVSDAGTPLLSDPGLHLVAAAQAAGVAVRAVPGPSAVVAALSVAGLPASRFAFEGFLPARAGARRTALAALAHEPRTLVFLEAPHRILEMLADAAVAFGPGRRCCVARELTKLHETHYPGTLAEAAQRLAAHPGEQRGEFVVVIEGDTSVADPSIEEGKRVLTVLLEYLKPGDAATAAAALTGQRRNDLYALALTLRARAD